MAIALVQSVKKVVTGATGSTTLAYGSNVTAANLLCVSQAHWQDTDEVITTPIDTLTHTYVGMVAEQNLGAGASFNSLRSFYVANCSGGANTVTFDSVGAEQTDITVVIAEFSGALTASPLGVTSSGTGTGTAVSSGTTATLDQATGMLWGAMMHAGSDTTIAETGGATIVQENEGGTSNMPIGVSYELTTAGTAQAATWTLGASNNWAAHVAFFKAAGDPPALPGNGGGGFDDRVRVENSVFVGNGTGAGARTFRSRWPNSTRDLKWDDQRADNRSRML